jgi:hypothetical protein
MVITSVEVDQVVSGASPGLSSPVTYPAMWLTAFSVALATPEGAPPASTRGADVPPESYGNPIGRATWAAPSNRLNRQVTRFPPQDVEASPLTRSRVA